MSSLIYSADEVRLANGRIQAFTRQFGRGHLHLAYHAAFPLALTPDMAYRIWATFQRDEWDQLLQIPWIAVADLLLSNLCEEIGHELYQMNLAVRDNLLGELVAHPALGQPRLRQLARFLGDYVAVEMKGTDAYEQRLAQSQRWVALAYQGPQTAAAAAQNIAATLKQNEGSPLEVARLSSLVQQIRQPLQEAGFANLVQYGQVAWTLVHGEEDGRSQAASADIASSPVQVGDVILNIPHIVTPAPPVQTSQPEPEEERSEEVAKMDSYRLSLTLDENSLTFFGEWGFEDQVRLRPDETAELINSLHQALRQIAWGDEEPYESGKRYRYAGNRDEGRLQQDVIRLALRGHRIYSTLIGRLADGANRQWDFEEAMLPPGQIQLAVEAATSAILPIGLFYDYPLDDGLQLADFALCPDFLAAWHQGKPLAKIACFQGNCPTHDEVKVICPSGFWGFRHSLGLPLSSTTAPDAPNLIPFRDTPQIAVTVSTNPSLRRRSEHEAALRSMGFAYDYADNLDEAVNLMRGSQAQLFYFYCEGGTKGDVPFLSFGPGDDLFTVATLGNSRIRWTDRRPLLFINGPHIVMKASEQLELIRAFVETSHAAGVVGTDITTFEPLATSFAEEFLRHFMFEGRTAGEAVREARLALLQQGNPLGLVYSLYALPGLRLVPAETPAAAPAVMAPKFVEPFDFEAIIQSKASEMPVNEAALAAINSWRTNPEGERLFLVTGERRSGKSTLAAHLAQQDFVSAYHYCTSDDPPTLDPLRFIESVAAQLGNRYEAYGQALASAVPPPHVSPQKTTQSFASEAPLPSPEAAGQRLNLSGLSLTEALLTYIVEPFHALFASDFGGEVILVLDGPDKAMTEVAGFTIPGMLTQFERVSPRLRLVVTGRPLPQMVEALRPLGVQEYALSPPEIIVGWVVADYLNRVGDTAIATAMLNIRAEPGTQAPVVYQLLEGERVVVTGQEQGGWLPVHVVGEEETVDDQSNLTLADLLQQIQVEVERRTDMVNSDKGLIMRDLGDGLRALNNINVSFVVHHLSRAIEDLKRFRPDNAEYMNIVSKIELVMKRARAELSSQ